MITNKKFIRIVVARRWSDAAIRGNGIASRLLAMTLHWVVGNAHFGKSDGIFVRHNKNAQGEVYHIIRANLMSKDVMTRLRIQEASSDAMDS